MRTRTLISVGLAAAAFAVGACGDDDEDTDTAGGGQETATQAQPQPRTETAPTEVGKDLKQKPAIPKPSGSPPDKLEIQDVVKGKGKVARAGDTVTVQYVGVSFSTGAQFDASWDRGQPFEFALGAGMVIPGWDEGVAGMRVGGRRQLTIPPEQAYGAQGQPPDIGPNETLVFVIDLIDVG